MLIGIFRFKYRINKTEMKNSIFLMILVSAAFFTDRCFAQFEVRAEGGGSVPALFSNSNYGQSIAYNGTTPSPDFVVKTWVSPDRTFAEDEVVSTNSYTSVTPGTNFRNNYSWSTPVNGDTRALTDIVGSLLYFQTCVEVVGQPSVCRVRSSEVIPPASPNFSASQGTSQQGVILQFTLQTRNAEDPFDFLRVTRLDRALDRGPSLSTIEIDIQSSDVTLVSDGVNQKTYQTIVESPAGTPARFTLRQCFNNGFRQCNIQTSSANSELGYRQSVASATTGEIEDRIIVQWPRFALTSTFEAYLVTRCEVNAPDRCEETKVLSTVSTPGGTGAETFEDFTAQRGIEYTYLVDACVGLNPNQCRTGDYDNIALSGPAFRGLVDEFESDDSPDQATLVTETVSQLRSFHTSLDDDWVRIELSEESDVEIETAPFRSNIVDTVLTLYEQINGELLEIENNDDLDFAKIETLRLEKGTYFLKSTHFKLIPDGESDPIIPAPIIPNYFLNIRIERSNSVSISPIINLILDQ